MLCEKCGKRNATFHYTEVVGGMKNEHHLCQECAANTDASYYSSLFDSGFHFGQLLSGILGGQNIFTDEEKIDPAKQVQCPNCGLTYGDFIKNSTFGCAECYDVFGPLIADKIKKIQGSDTHAGKKPMLYTDNSKIVSEGLEEVEVDITKEIDILSKKLKEAVLCEDFYEAAKLRDKIAELKGEGGKNE